MASYVAQYSTGWVVLVNDKWYGPGCVLSNAVWPNLDSAVWSDLIAAQDCYNAKIGGDSNDGTKGTCPAGSHWNEDGKVCVKDGDVAKTLELFWRQHFTTVLLLGGGFFAAKLLMQGGKRR